MMTAAEISPIIENFNIGNICTVIADMCVADTGNIAVPVIADIGVNGVFMEMEKRLQKTVGDHPEQRLFSRTLFSCFLKNVFDTTDTEQRQTQ